MVAALASVKFNRAAAAPPVHGGSPLDAQLEYLAQAEAGFEAVCAALITGLPPIEGMDHSMQIIAGSDGSGIALYISRRLTGPGYRVCCKSMAAPW